MSFIKFLFTKAFLKQLLYAAIVLIALTFLLLWWLKFTTNHGQALEVPDLSKMTLDKVGELLDESDLRYEIMDSANYNPDYPRFSVIEQVPKSGHLVKENRKIYLALNPSGYAKINIPKVTGKTLRQAEPTLLAMGFRIGKISKRAHISDQVLELRYKGARIKAGDAIEKTSKIDVIVGDGSLNRVQEETNDDEGNTQDNTE